MNEYLKQFNVSRRLKKEAYLWLLLNEWFIKSFLEIHKLFYLGFEKVK